MSRNQEERNLRSAVFFYLSEWQKYAVKLILYCYPWHYYWLLYLCLILYFFYNV